MPRVTFVCILAPSISGFTLVFAYFSECNITSAPGFDDTSMSITTSTDEPFFYGASIAYQCLDPAESITDGASIVICQRNGTWLPDSIGTCVQTRK